MLLFASNIYWHLPIMIVLISLVYSATRYDSWKSIFIAAFRWGLQMLIFLVAIALALTALAYAI